MKKIFLLNSSSGIVQVIFNASLFLITTPFLLRYLGSEQYGVFALITTLGSIGFFINFGFNLSLIKFIAEQGKSSESDKDIILALLISSVLVTIVTAITIFYNDQILKKILNLPPQYINVATFYLFNAIVLSNILLFTGQIFSAVIDSQQKMYITNALQIFYNAGNRIGILLVVIAGGSFIDIGTIYILSTASWFIVLVILFFKHWKFTSLNGLFETIIQRIHKHGRYGFKIYLTSISGFFYEPFIKILIGRFIGLTEVGVFDVAFRMKTMIWTAIERAIYPITPIIARYDEKENRILINWLSKKILLVSIPISAAIFFIIEPVIHIWLGANNELIIETSRILISVYLLTASGIPIYLFLMIKNHPEKTFIIQLLNALFSVILFFLFVPQFGYYGSVYAFVCAVLMTQMLLMWWQKKYMGQSIFLPLDDLMRSISIAMIVIMLNYVINILINNNIVKAASFFFIDFATVIWLLYRYSIITDGDIAKIFGGSLTIKQLRKKLFNI